VTINTRSSSVLGADLSLRMGLNVQAIAPAAAYAYTGTVNVTIDVQPTETYDTLVRRAEAIVWQCRAKLSQAVLY